jgi:hypothetical protein
VHWGELPAKKPALGEQVPRCLWRSNDRRMVSMVEQCAKFHSVSASPDNEGQ